MPLVRVTVIGALLAIAVATPCAPAQDRDGSTSASWPRITVTLPDSVAADGVWIRYSLWGRGESGGTIKHDSNQRQYVIDAMVGGKPAENAKIVIYVPGCEFKTLVLAVGATDIAENFECVPLPKKVVHGLLPSSEIPASMVPAEKRLVVTGELETAWICGFLLERRHGPDIIIAGSCLGSPVPLGTVGELDPSKGGDFEIAVPDFARDPAFRDAGEGQTIGNASLIYLALRDKTVGRVMETLKVKDRAALGLEVEADYPDPVLFTRVRFSVR